MKRKVIKFTHFLILISLTITMILLLVIGVLLYNKTKHILEENINQIHSMKLNQASADVRKQFEDIYKAFDGFRNNELFIGTVRGLTDVNTSSYERFILSKSLETSITNFKLGNAFIDNVIVMTPEQQFSSNLKYLKYFFEGDPLNLSMDHEQIVYVPPGKTYELFHLDRNEVPNQLLRDVINHLDQSTYFISRLNDQEGEQISLMVLQLNMNAMNTQIPYADSLAILGENGYPLFRGVEIETEVPQKLWTIYDKDKEDYNLNNKHYAIRSIGFNELRMVFVEPEIEFHRNQVMIIAWYSIMALIGSALSSYIFSRWIGKKVLLPLHGLVRWIRGFERLEDRWDAGSGKAVNTRITTMRERLFLYFLLTIMLPTLLFVVLFYVQSMKVVSKEVQQTYYALFEKSANRLELFVNQKEMAMTWLAYNSTVAELLEQPRVDAQQVMDELLFTRTFSSLSEDTVSIYDISNRLIYTNRYKQAPRMDASLYEIMIGERKNMFYWLPPVETGSSTVSLSMSIVNIQTSSEFLGFLKTDVNNVYFSSLYSELNGNGSEAFVVDEGGRILSHPEVEKVGQMAKLPAAPGSLNGLLMEDHSTMYFSSQISGLPWYLITVFDSSTVREQAVGLMYDDIYLFIIIFLLILVLSYLMSQYLVRPLSSLHMRFLEMDLDHVDRFSRDDSYLIDEVEQLRASFNRLLERIEYLVDDKLKANNERLQLEFEKKETQMEALQAQINPHFLHNTLEIVMYMIEKSERERAIDMIGLLSRLFRYAMGKDSQLTLLREEVAYAKTYIRIMSLRYKDRISCEWSIDEALMECSVVKMILQPILENAIRHSLKLNSGTVMISVSITREGDNLLIAITDNGPSISESKLGEIHDTLDRRDRRKVGLYNVNSRIRLHYGEEYGITLTSRVPTGVTVTLKLPIPDDLSMQPTTNM